MKENEEIKKLVENLVSALFDTYHNFIISNKKFNEVDNKIKGNVVLNAITHFSAFFIHEILKKNMDEGEVLERGKEMIDDIFNLFKRVYVAEKIIETNKH